MCNVENNDCVRLNCSFLQFGKYFKLSLTGPKSLFYKAANALYSKTEYKFYDIVMIKLITFCGILAYKLHTWL